MSIEDHDEDAYAAGIAAAQELAGVGSLRLMHQASEALASYLDQRELLLSSPERGRLGAIVSSFCNGFFATLDLD